MAHHSSTPQNVLDAPTRTIVTTHTPEGATRQERRHGVADPGFSDPIPFALYMARLRQDNVPAVRSTPRRGRKVRRAGLASS